ncbi:MAG: hypothetical protein V4773_28485 [Verrucomicrobiota bacterium]
MRTVLLLALFALSCGAAHAQWHDLKAGLDPKTVVQAVGQPLLVSKSKSGAQVTWTYDEGAYVMFDQGRVRFWQQPKVKR